MRNEENHRPGNAPLGEQQPRCDDGNAGRNPVDQQRRQRQRQSAQVPRRDQQRISGKNPPIVFRELR
jgi:hypothetical protein